MFRSYVLLTQSVRVLFSQHRQGIEKCGLPEHTGAVRPLDIVPVRGVFKPHGVS